MATRHVAPDDPATFVALRKREFLEAAWTLPKAAEPGYHRALACGLRATSCSMSHVTLPVGQGTPVHSNTAEHLILNLSGQVEFRYGEESVELGPFDTLFIPANVPYAYFNIGADDVRFISVLGMVDSWPPVGKYDYPE